MKKLDCRLTNGTNPSIFHKDSDVHDLSGVLRPGPPGRLGVARGVEQPQGWKAVDSPRAAKSQVNGVWEKMLMNPQDAGHGKKGFLYVHIKQISNNKYIHICIYINIHIQ